MLILEARFVFVASLLLLSPGFSHFLFLVCGMQREVCVWVLANWLTGRAFFLRGLFGLVASFDVSDATKYYCLYTTHLTD